MRSMAVSSPVERFGEAAIPAAVRLWEDVGNGALFFDQAADRVAVIGLVGEHDRTAGNASSSCCAALVSAVLPDVRRKRSGRPSP